MGYHRGLATTCVVMVALGYVTASGANAAIWKSGGAEIPAGTMYNALVEKKGANANYTLTTGALTTITCTTQANTKQSMIVGGPPGRFRSVMKLTGCTVTNPSTCQVKETNVNEITLTIQGELAEYESGLNTYLPIGYTLIRSNNFELENRPGEMCPAATTEKNPYMVSGTSLAQIKPEQSEQSKLALTFQTTYLYYRFRQRECFNGAALSVITKLGTERATLVGESEIEEEGGAPKINFGAYL
jgi:hypothetical protein